MRWFRRISGALFFFSGMGLLVFQFYLWRHGYAWKPYRLSIVVEAVVHGWGDLVEHYPFASPEGVEMMRLFRASDLPYYIFRFFETIPISGFMMVIGYFLLRWEKYLGSR